MITSITDIQTYKRCRRRWDYSSSLRRNLTGIGVGKPALELGSLVHAALASWTIDPDGEQIINDIAIKDYGVDKLSILSKSVPVNYYLHHCNERIKAIKEQYQKVVGAAPSEQELESIYEPIDLGMHMIENYYKRWGIPLPEDFIFAVPEQEVVVDIPGTEHDCSCVNDDPFRITARVNPDCQECNGTGIAVHKLRAILDGIIQNNEKQFFILERKTYGSRPSYDSLQTNDQFVGYMWVATRLGIEPLMGIAYDGLWKRKAPPRGSKFEDLFARTTIDFSLAEIESWGEELAKVVNEMASNPAIYPNRRWEGCKDCSFDKLCTMQSKGEDYEHYIRLAYTQRENTKPVLAQVKE